MFDMTFLLLKKCIEKILCLELNSKKKSKPIGAKAENIDWPCWGMVWAFPLIYMSAAYLKIQIKDFVKSFHLT